MLWVPLGGRARDWECEWREEAFSLLQVLGDLGSYRGEMLPSSPQPPPCCCSPPASRVDAAAPLKVPFFSSPWAMFQYFLCSGNPLDHFLCVCVFITNVYWVLVTVGNQMYIKKQSLTFLCLEVSPLGTDGSTSFSLSFLLIFPK